MTDTELETVVKSWKSLNKCIKDLTEQQLKLAIQMEVSGSKRKDILVRLHQRYTIIRATREREELLDVIADVPAFLAGVME